MLFIILLIVLILIILSNIQENFKCPKPPELPRKCIYPFDGEWTKCPSHSLYPGEKCYACPWKRPGLDNKSRAHCCHNKCYQRKKFAEGDPYYCVNSNGNGCYKKYAKDCRERTCGNRMLYNTPMETYDTLDKCENSLNRYQDLNKEQCLLTTGAGWCTDYLGEGLCVPGTPLGPTNLIQYYTCFPNQRTNKNAWTYE